MVIVRNCLNIEGCTYCSVDVIDMKTVYMKIFVDMKILVDCDFLLDEGAEYCMLGFVVFPCF